MTPEEAIRILEEEIGGMIKAGGGHWDDAILLGIEALKRHKHNEECFEKDVVKPLPGETKE